MASIHSRPQRPDAAVLQLLDCSLAPSESRSDLPDASSFGESHGDHSLLIQGKLAHETKERGPILDVGHCRTGDLLVALLGLLARVALEMIGNRIGGDPIEPGR